MLQMTSQKQPQPPPHEIRNNSSVRICSCRIGTKWGVTSFHNFGTRPTHHTASQSQITFTFAPHPTSGRPGTVPLRHATNDALTPAPLSRWSEVTRRRRSCASPSSPPTNQASPTSSSGKIINSYAALLHDPACRTKTRERRGKAEQPTQKINPVRYCLSGSGDCSEQKVRKSVSESVAGLRAILC